MIENMTVINFCRIHTNHPFSGGINPFRENKKGGDKLLFDSGDDNTIGLVINDLIQACCNILVKSVFVEMKSHRHNDLGQKKNNQQRRYADDVLF